jgi:LysM repeat protein
VSPNMRESETASHKSTKSKSSKQLQAATAKNTVLHHRVKEGETLYSIASNYNTTVAALKRDNRNVAVLRPGMVLVINPLK